MKDLPFAVRVSAVAGLVLLFAVAGIVCAESMIRIYGGALDLIDYVEVAGTWGSMLIAGVALGWGDRLRARNTHGSSANGVVALITFAVCAILAFIMLRYSVSANPLELWRHAAFPAGFALAAGLALLRAVNEFGRA